MDLITLSGKKTEDNIIFMTKNNGSFVKKDNIPSAIYLSIITQLESVYVK